MLRDHKLRQPRMAFQRRSLVFRREPGTTLNVSGQGFGGAASLAFRPEPRVNPVGASLPLPRLEARKLIPQFPRRNDGEVFNFPKVEQFFVASHEHIRFPGNGASEDRDIVGVFDWNGRIFARFDYYTFRFQQGKEAADNRSRQAELLGEDPFKLPEHRPARQQLVVMNDAFQQFAAQTARGDAARQDVRVEKDLQETLRNTSSSVR